MTWSAESCIPGLFSVMFSFSVCCNGFLVLPPLHIPVVKSSHCHLKEIFIRTIIADEVVESIDMSKFLNGVKTNWEEARKGTQVWNKSQEGGGSTKNLNFRAHFLFRNFKTSHRHLKSFQLQCSCPRGQLVLWSLEDIGMNGGYKRCYDWIEDINWKILVWMEDIKVVMTE